MKNTSPSRSMWLESLEHISLAALENNVTVDVCVVGAGIAGMTSAYLLAKSGKSVAVIEARTVGSGETGRTTAHIVTAHDDRYVELEKWHGQEGARIAAESFVEAIRTIEEIIQTEQIDCDFMRLPGYLFLGPEQDASLLEHECDSAHRAGLADVELITHMPTLTKYNGPALQFSNQAQFHPGKFLVGLSRVLQNLGCKIYTNSPVQKIENTQSGVLVTTRKGKTIQCGAVIQATNCPLYAPKILYTKQAPYRTFVIAATIGQPNISPALFWDTGHPYHYIRFQQVGEQMTVIIGGEDHRTGEYDDAEERYARLESWGREQFPQMAKVIARWSGQVQEPIDGVAFIGEHSSMPHVYYITGDSGTGMTHGVVGAIMLCDMINGKTHPWSALYRPDRFRIHSLGTYMREGVPVAKALIKRLQPKKHSPHCSHMGCALSWNTGEGSWDCPCHGSRFNQSGQVISAPAITDVKTENTEGA